MSRTVYILCEGYDDRNFLAGYLENRGWAASPDHYRRSQEQLIKSDYTFTHEDRSPDSVVAIRQVGGKSRLVKAARLITKKLSFSNSVGILLIRDADTHASTTCPEGSYLKALADADGVAPEDSPDASNSTWAHRGVSYAECSWATSTPDSPGLPAKQTLERLVCDAMVREDSERADAVNVWLEAIPRGSVGEKAYAYSYFAKWRTGLRGDFYKLLWSDDGLATHLERLVDQRSLRTSLNYLFEAP